MMIKKISTPDELETTSNSVAILSYRDDQEIKNLCFHYFDRLSQKYPDNVLILLNLATLHNIGCGTSKDLDKGKQLLKKANI